MAKGIYIGVSGKARKVKKMYVGVNGVARKVTNGYVGVNGAARQFWAGGTPISTKAEGSTVQVKEGSALIDFYVAKHNYESGLNGAGRTLLVRKDCYDLRKWHTSNVNAYASSDIDSWLNSTYKALLNADIQAELSTTTFYCTPGNGDKNVGTLARAVFLLSMTELGKSNSYANTEGASLSIADTLKIAYLDGAATTYWLRSPYTSGTTKAWRMGSSGNTGYGNCSENYGTRPCFTMPGNFAIEDLAK